jgi:Protein of unknown function (DUF2950)
MKQGMINMIDHLLQNHSGHARSATVPFALLAIWITSGAYPGLAQQSPQPAFSSAAEATQSLFRAVQSNNEHDIANVLGGPTELTSSSDEGQDKIERELFVQKYQEMHRLGLEPDGCVTLYIGAENWPFPIPLVKKDGVWRFDSDAGTKEIMFRRIGENELTAIAVCHEFIAAAKHDLTAPDSANREDGPAARLVAAEASESSGADPELYHGYYFRRLPTSPTSAPRQKAGKTAMRGLVLIAYPVEYRSTGVMTFVVTDRGTVYEKDLGTNTLAIGTVMAAFHKDATWRAAEE